MVEKITLGSLFDGSGGFPLAGLHCGITPVWASEIEPFPIRVTTKRIPQMKHYGDVTKVNGAEIEPVDIITFGSPCTDLSVAGKQAGLCGTQSNLFYEAIRIIKEMREKTNGLYPRYAVWENVPGAFSTNKGEDFRAVLTAFVQINVPTAEVPAVENGKWAYADTLVGDTWSIAYRVLDAQYFGVPQRRRRIFLVADFRGDSVHRILFEQTGVSRDFTPCGKQEQGTAKDVTQSTGKPVVVALEHHATDSRIKIESNGKIQTLTNRMGTGGNNVPLLYILQGSMVGREEKNDPQGSGIGENISFTLTSTDRHAVADTTAYTIRRLTPLECARLQGFPDWWCHALGEENPTEEEVQFWTNVWEAHRNIVGTSTKPKSRNQIIKWIKNPHSDMAEYKMWGNGLALPCAIYVLKGIVERGKTEYTTQTMRHWATYEESGVKT